MSLRHTNQSLNRKIAFGMVQVFLDLPQKRVGDGKHSRAQQLQRAILAVQPCPNVLGRRARPLAELSPPRATASSKTAIFKFVLFDLKTRFVSRNRSVRKAHVSGPRPGFPDHSLRFFGSSWELPLSAVEPDSAESSSAERPLSFTHTLLHASNHMILA